MSLKDYNSEIFIRNGWEFKNDLGTFANFTCYPFFRNSIRPERKKVITLVSPFSCKSGQNSSNSFQPSAALKVSRISSRVTSAVGVGEAVEEARVDDGVELSGECLNPLSGENRGKEQHFYLFLVELTSTPSCASTTASSVPASPRTLRTASAGFFSPCSSALLSSAR